MRPCEVCGTETEVDDLVGGVCYDCAHDEVLTEEEFLESLRHPGAQRVTFDEEEADGR